MKIRIDVDCTPDEARAFFGLPEVKPLQDAMMADVEGRLKAALAEADPETLLKTWMPVGVQGLAEMQKAFWQQFAGGKGGKGKGGKEE